MNTLLCEDRYDLIYIMCSQDIWVGEWVGGGPGGNLGIGTAANSNVSLNIYSSPTFPLNILIEIDNSASGGLISFNKN